MAALLTVTSAVAYMLFVVLISFLPFDKKDFAFNMRQFIRCIPLFLAFLFIPVGFLPAFLQIDYAYFITAFFCLCSVMLQKIFTEKGIFKLLLVTFISFALLGFLLRIVLNLGLPGAKYSMDILCNADLLKGLDVYGKTFAVFAIFSFICAAYISIKVCNKFFASIFVLLCCTTVTSIIFPALNFGCRYGSCYIEFVAGFASFWLIVLALRKVLMYKFTETTKH